MGSQEPFDRLLKCRFVFHVCLISVFVIVVNPKNENDIRKFPPLFDRNIISKFGIIFWTKFHFSLFFNQQRHGIQTASPRGSLVRTEWLPEARKTPGIVPRPIGRAFQEADGRGEGEGFKTKRQAPQVGRRDKRSSRIGRCAPIASRHRVSRQRVPPTVALSTEPASRNRRVNQ